MSAPNSAQQMTRNEMFSENLNFFPETPVSSFDVLNALDIPVSVYNVKMNRFTLVNNKFVQLTGLPPEEFSHDRPSHHKICSWINEQDRDRFRETIFPMVQDYCRENIHFDTEKVSYMFNVRMKKSPDSEAAPQVLVHSNVTRWDENRMPLEIMSIYINVEDRKFSNKTHLTIRYARSEEDSWKVGRSIEFRQEPEQLARREKEILQLMLEDFSATRIAIQKNISVFTVRAHWRNILHKTNCHSQKELKSLALREGWV